MRSVLLIVGGVLLWGLCLAAAHVTAGSGSRSLSLATATFAALWLLASAANLWVGVFRAGYTLREELPIFLLIFGVPVVVALIVKIKYGSGAN